jgi:hypothetical protein
MLVNPKKDWQKPIIILGALLVVGLIAAPGILPFVIPEKDIPIITGVDVTAYHDPGTPRFDNIVTVYANGRSVMAAFYDGDTSFIIAADSSASGLYFVDGVDCHFPMVDTGDGRNFVGNIPAYPVGTRISYCVSMTIDGFSDTSGTTTYTVSDYPEEPPDTPPEDPIPIQMQMPPESTSKVILDDGTEISWQMFLTSVVWGTVHFEVEFTKCGDRIYSISLEIDRIDPEEEGSGYWYFSLKEGGSYIWELDWDTTAMPDGEYIAVVNVRYWTGDTEPISGNDPDIEDVPWSVFTLGGTEHGWNVNAISKLIVVVGFFVIAVVGIVGMKEMGMLRRRRRR